MPDKTNSEIYKYISSLIKRYSAFIFSVLALTILAECASVFGNYQIKEIIDSIVKNPSIDIISILIAFVIYRGICHGLYFVICLLGIKYRPPLLRESVYDAYKVSMDHSLLWFDSKLSGEISSKIHDFQDSIISLINTVPRAMSHFILVIVSIGFLMLTNRISGMCVALFALSYVTIMFFLMKKQMRLQEDFSNAKQNTVGIVNDSISNVFSIKAIGNIDTETKMMLSPALLRWSSKLKDVLKYDAYYIDIADTAIIMSMWISQIFILSFMYKAGKITAGGFAFIATSAMNIHHALYDMMNHIVFDINPKIADFRAAYSLLSSDLLSQNVSRETKMEVNENFKGSIKYENVTFRYGEGCAVLDKFNLNIAAGEKVGIVGKTGAGKSTLIKCLLRYSSLSGGRILINGEDISDITDESIAKIISIIPQDITMFHRSIKENIEIAKYGASMDEIQDACKAAHIHDDIMKMKNGYDAMIGERGVKISGGQRQRIAIARAILKRAPILVLDEATSSLDAHTEDLVQKSIEALLMKKNVTMLVIAHRLSTLRNMQRIVVIDEGKSVEEGTHSELFSMNGAYRNLWDTQMHGFIGA